MTRNKCAITTADHRVTIIADFSVRHMCLCPFDLSTCQFDSQRGESRLTEIERDNPKFKITAL